MIRSLSFETFMICLFEMCFYSCTVCLGEYEEKDMLRVLPACGHTFHINCIDVWLHQHSTCPVCRLSLRDSCDGRSMQPPSLSMAAQSRYGPGAISESLLGQSYSSFNNNIAQQSTARIQGQDQPTASLIIQADQYGNDHCEIDGFNSERQLNLYHVTEDNWEGKDLHHMQYDDAVNAHTQFVSHVFAESMIHEVPRKHSFWRGKDLVEGCMEAGNPAKVQERQGPVFVQIDSSDTTASCSQGQHRMNARNADQFLETSGEVDRYHSSLTASDVLEKGALLNLDERQKMDSATESLGLSLIPCHIEDRRDPLDTNISSCEGTAKDGSTLATHDVRSDESNSTACIGRNCNDVFRSLERNLALASEGAIASLTVPSTDLRTKTLEQESSDGVSDANSQDACATQNLDGNLTSETHPRREACLIWIAQEIKCEDGVKLTYLQHHMPLSGSLYSQELYVEITSIRYSLNLISGMAVVPKIKGLCRVLKEMEELTWKF
eukprot:Gb_03844 [translate_table: standard]